jgi:hypothetical protein
MNVHGGLRKHIKHVLNAELLLHLLVLALSHGVKSLSRPCVVPIDGAAVND